MNLRHDIRERVWIEKFDHTEDGPPRLFETVFIEDGEVVEVVQHGPAPDLPQDKSASS